ncbi:3-hydroxybutyryl-CoA dehydrogenase [Actinomadura graeca]|uniref:3-hydroxybutyryl-CoA dehydrogenase n=1 Tax=Actinomadura graeca TaxID=2750812 RepID=A0ABX8QSG3_9ACTN|nr:3-hydroxyacyl-CoA dehydrogenase NAD-binding domain-containing protein [Actinomadura graeca]QXJ21749.1 3-hydroxybutyryl-CoA dehydrogenase [Actinomadura graeca]
MTGASFGRVGVVGLGTMGAGIAEVLARGGLPVVGVEVDGDALERGRGHLERSTGRAVKRGRLTEEGRREILDRVALSVGFAELGDCDLVIEAVPERLDLKRRVFAELDKVCRPDAVLATNTSSLSVTDIAVTTGRPTKIVGVHFFNPAPVMRLVEVIRTVLTEPEAVERVAALAEALGKTPVTIGDRAGFVANRLLFGYLNQAAAMLDSGHATRDDIDTAMTAGAGLPMGPFALMDLIGLDTCLGILEAVHAETRDPRHAPSPALRERVTAGLLGRKSGHGFHVHDGRAVQDEAAGPGTGASAPTVGVLGTGPLADAVAALCDRAGGRVRTAAADLGDCDLVIECAQDAEAGRALLAAAAESVKDGAVLAATSTGVPVVEQAVATGRPGDVVGLHLPEADGTLAEIAATVVTAPGVADRAADLAGRLGLTVVRCRDRAGFIVDALRFPYLNDAAAMLGAGYAGADAIDAAMTLGCGYPSGPIADLDRLGPGRAVAVLRALYAETRDASFAPAPLLVEHATAGRPLR